MDQLLDRIVTTAEARFGPRCAGWEFRGVKFHADHPTMRYIGESAVIIYIRDTCKTDHNQAIYQCGHEAVHMLSPEGGRRATVLEEGIATEFAASYLLDERGVMLFSSGAYLRAQRLYQSLQRCDYHIVRRMREEQPVISFIEADLITRYCPRIDANTARQLAERFSQ